MVDNSCARTRSARGRRQPLQRDVTNKHLLAVLSPKDGRSVDAVVYTSDRWEGVSLRLSTGGRARLVREACSRAGRTRDLLGTVGRVAETALCVYRRSRHPLKNGSFCRQVFFFRIWLGQTLKTRPAQHSA